MFDFLTGEALDVIRFYRMGWEPIQWHDGRIRWGLKQTDRRVAVPTHTDWRDASEGEIAVLAETGGIPERHGVKYGSGCPCPSKAPGH